MEEQTIKSENAETAVKTPTESPSKANLKPPWKKGQSGNPKGKPPGTISPIQRVKQIFLQNPAVFKEFLEGYITDPSNRKHIVEMIDGKPKEKVDITTGGYSLLDILKYGLKSNAEHNEAGSAELPSESKTDAS